MVKEDLRPQLSQSIKRFEKNGDIVAEPDQIIVTNGAVEGLDLSLAVLTEPRDKIAVFDPCYTVSIDA